jgi:hypothetical protein
LFLRKSATGSITVLIAVSFSIVSASEHWVQGATQRLTSDGASLLIC